MVPGFSKLFMATPGALRLGAAIWCFFTLRFRNSHASTRDMEALIAHRAMKGLNAAITHIHPTERISTFLGSSEMTVSVLAKLLVSQLHGDVNRDSEVLKFLVILWEGDFGPEGGTLQCELQSLNFIPKLLDRISFLSLPTNPVPLDDYNQGVYVGTSYRVLVDCMVAGDGISWLRRGLRRRFIHTYVAWTDLWLYMHTLESERMAVELHSMLLVNTLIGQMMHPDIFALIDKAFHEIEEDARLFGLHQKLLRAKNPLGKDWSDLLHGRNKARRHVHVSTKTGDILQYLSVEDQPCFNALCEDPWADIKTCSHCRGAFYCSRKCQALDYSVHRQFCHWPIVLPSVYKLLQPQAISRTKYFIANVAFHEILHNTSSTHLRLLRDQYRSLRLQNRAPGTKMVIELRMEPGPVFAIPVVRDLKGSDLMRKLYGGSLEKLQRHPQCLRENGLEGECEEEDVIHLDIRCISFQDVDTKEEDDVYQFRIHAVVRSSSLLGKVE